MRCAFVGGSPPATWHQCRPHRSTLTRQFAPAAEVCSGRKCCVRMLTVRDPGYVASLDIEQQKKWLIGIAIGTVVETTVLCRLLESWQPSTNALAGLYLIAGAAHFFAESIFTAIYPKKGAWGLWYLPGSPRFHVYWTGVAEILGGAGILLGKYSSEYSQLGQAAAFGLFLLNLAVFPANIYMFTHNAKVVVAGKKPPADIPVAFHLFRLPMQPLLLVSCWNLFH
eukprot:Plantae.Rhodophyta-Purpureofilum_apyrenoidigerum.ctg14607.p1 GENE.Plantae.Rhodophyta-Purpureofilum_apyrenoidigerum.ctg14607~~Plantae.Rhodophyta-Purpureofilum_apyrenoidigerum.ctg14607.p1  ORF type:complete len:225 (+),score=12.86 Plantae.Rhodophyta-Purpureofilum_apyrenoidigerum.ctg14607:246-920(+)